MLKQFGDGSTGAELRWLYDVPDAQEKLEFPPWKNLNSNSLSYG